MSYLTLSFTFLIIAALLDVITTVKVLKLPDTYEANPIIRWFMDKLGSGWIVVKLALTLAIGYYCFINAYMIALVIATLITLYAAWNNWSILRDS